MYNSDPKTTRQPSPLLSFSPQTISKTKRKGKENDSLELSPPQEQRNKNNLGIKTAITTLKNPSKKSSDRKKRQNPSVSIPIAIQNLG